MRHHGPGATTFTCGYDGTAVDPYAASTYMWKTNPPSTGRDLDFSGDGYSDVLGREPGSSGVLCLVAGNGTGGWIPNPDLGCRDGSPIGWEWDNFNLILRPGDFNGDGYSDVMGRIPGGDGLLCLVAGNGSGGWIANPDPPCWDGTLIGSDWDVYDSIIGPGDFSGDGFNDLLGRKPNGDLCLIRGNGYGDWIRFTWNPTCGDGLRIGTGWNMYNWLVAPSDFGGNGDSCPDVLGRQSASPYWMRLHSGSCGVNGYFKEQSGVPIESAWSVYNWLLSVGDFGGDICSDVLTRAGGGFLYMRRGNCNGGFTGGFSTIGSEWNLFNWIF